MQRQQRQRQLAFVFLVSFALRIAYCLVRGSLGQTGPGYLEYVWVGQRLVEHGTLTSPLVTDVVDLRPSALMPPAYSALVAVTYALLGVNTFAATLALHLVNACASSLAVLFVFLIVRALTDIRTAWVGALIAAINPLLLGFTDYIWDTSLYALGAIVALWLSIRLSEKPRGAVTWLGFGVYLGMLALLNPALTVVYPVLVLWPVVSKQGWKPWPMTRAALPAICGWAIAIAPWTVRNYVQFGDVLYVRNGLMLEFWLGAAPEADAHGAAVYAEQYPLLNQEVQSRISSTGEAAFLDECRSKASKAIVENPLRFARLCGLRTLDYWLGTVFTHAAPGQSGWPKRRERAIVTLFLTLEVLVVAVCLLLRTRELREIWWLLALVLPYSFVYCVTHVQVRYRAPIEPLVAVIVSIAVVKLLGARRSPENQTDTSDSILASTHVA